MKTKYDTTMERIENLANENDKWRNYREGWKRDYREGWSEE